MNRLKMVPGARASGAFLAGLVLVNAALYAANWSGDPEVHIVFARHFAAGMPFQFNAGEFSTGETSPLYMILVAGLVAGLPLPWVPFGMKALGVLAALGIAWQVRGEAVRKLGPGAVSSAVALGFLAMPLVWFQAWLGMENMLMACVMMPLVGAVLRRPSADWDARRLSVTALFLGFASLLRPEAVFFGMALSAHLLFGRRFLAAGLSLLGCLGIALGLMVGIEHFTGVPLHGAGHVRAVFSRMEAFQLSVWGRTLSLQSKPLRMLVFTWPALLFLAVGLRRRRSVPGEVSALLFFCVLLPAVLQLFGVTPSIHSSRYLLPSYATLFMLLPTLIADASLAKGLVHGVLVAAAVLGFGLENWARYRAGLRGFWGDWSKVTVNLDAARRRSVSEHLCRVAGCADGPLVVAAQEVQRALLLDERFVMRSLDGIVDHHLERYIRDWGVDHLAYLRERRVDLLVELPNYNLDPERFALRELYALAVGESRTVEDLTFTRLPGHEGIPIVIRVRRASTTAQKCVPDLRGP